MTTTRDQLAAAFVAGYDAAWNESGEGYNGEYTSPRFTTERYVEIRKVATETWLATALPTTRDGDGSCTGDESGLARSAAAHSPRSDGSPMTNSEILEHIGAEAERRALSRKPVQVACASAAAVSGVIKLLNAREEMPGVVRIATPVGWRYLQVDPSMEDGHVRFVSEYEALCGALDAHVAALMKKLGLELAGEMHGHAIVLPCRRHNRRRVALCERCTWPIGDYEGAPLGRWTEVECDPAKVLAMATVMVERIRTEHGPGNVWSLGGGLVHLVNDDGMWRYRDCADRMLIRLRSYHAHEADAREDA